MKNVSLALFSLLFVGALITHQPSMAVNSLKSVKSLLKDPYAKVKRVSRNANSDESTS